MAGGIGGVTCGHCADLGLGDMFSEVLENGGVCVLDSLEGCRGD